VAAAVVARVQSALAHVVDEGEDEDVEEDVLEGEAESVVFNATSFAAEGLIAEDYSVTESIETEIESRVERIREARMKGYEGDSCGECGNFTLVRNGTCMKCDTCGGTSGCS
jgi:ribonucleoside-diphosphate reductase alpha chain